jgi:hypothetical protein
MTVPCGQYDLTTESYGGQSTGCQQAVIFVSNDLKIGEVGYSSGQKFPWRPGRLRFVSHRGSKHSDGGTNTGRTIARTLAGGKSL